MNKNQIIRSKASIIRLLLPIFIGLFFLVGSLLGQVSIASGDAVAPQSFSILELLSNTGGLRLPHLTTVERNTLEATASFQAEKTGKGIGLMIYNTTTNCVNTWNGNQWIALCAPVSVTGIILDKPSVQLFVPNGYTWATPFYQLTATLSPSDASDKRITWSTGNPAVVTINEVGLVTAVGNGQTVVTATTTDGGYTASCTVTVGCGAATVDGGWLTFMCHNLGADPRIDPFTYVVGDATGGSGTVGYLYQWGRLSDGHQLRNSATTSTLSATDIPGHASFIENFSILDEDWRNPQVDILWGDGTANANPAKAANDPCPSGWKVPSQAQWASVFHGGTTAGTPGTATANTWTWTGHGYMVGRSLYLPDTGYRDSKGNLINAGEGIYWSSTVNGPYSYSLLFVNGYIAPGDLHTRVLGFSVRCVSE